MHRRRILAGAAGLLLAGCARSPDDPAAPVASGPATPPRYAWFTSGSGLTDAYALTWVQRLSPADVVTRMGARRLGYQRWPATGWSELPGLRPTDHVLAVTRARGWALVVEDSISLVGDDVIAELSKGTRLVGFSHNSLAADRFVLATDGTIEVDFDPGFPPDREGTRPGLLLDGMRAVGLDPADYGHVPPPLATLALAERVTHVPLTAALLHGSAYLAAAVTVTGQEDTEPQVKRPGF
jgi:hypothetical protein